VACPSKSEWDVDNGNTAFLSWGYDKGVVVKGAVRAAKKAELLSLSPSSKSPPGGRGARRARSRGTEGGRGGRRLPDAATDADVRCSDRIRPPSLLALASASSALAAPEAGATWECHKCSLPNNPSKKRCSSCQGWRGGLRESYSILAIYAA